MDMHPARLKPLSRENLGRGMSADAVDMYLSLMEQLYNAFYFDLDAEFVPLSEEEHRKKWLIREQLYKATPHNCGCESPPSFCPTSSV